VFFLTTHRIRKTCGSHLAACCTGALFFFLFLCKPVFADQAENDSYELKAALLYKLALFIEWPKTAFQGNEHSFGLCVLGENPFGTSLDIVKKRSINSRKINVRIFSKADEVKKDCHLIFLSQSNQQSVKQALLVLSLQPILTVSDISGFAEKNGMIEMITIDDRNGFRINRQVLQQAGLKAAASLLQLSDIVGDKQ